MDRPQRGLWQTLAGIFFMGVVLALAAYARWPEFPQPYLWLDEAWRAYAVSITHGPGSFITYMSQNTEVLLGSEWLLGKVSWLAWGQAPWGFRVWPFIFSLLAVAGVFALMRRAGQPEIALLAAMVVATAWGFIYHAREFKPYALDLALTLWTLWAALRAVESRHLGLLVLGLSVLACSSLVFMFVFPGVVVFWWIRTRPVNLRALLALSVPPAFFLAVYVFFLRPQNPAGTGAFWAGNYLNSVDQVIRLTRLYPDYIDAYSLFGWWVPTVLFFLVLPITSIRRRDGLWALFFIPVGVQVVAAIFRLYPFLDRPSYYLYGIINVGAAIALGHLLELVAPRSPVLVRRLKWGLVSALLLMVVFGGVVRRHMAQGKTWPPDTARRAMTILAQEFRAGDRLYINGPDIYPFLFHRDACFPVGHPLRAWSVPQRNDTLSDNDSRQLREQIVCFARNEVPGQRLWFLSGYNENTYSLYESLLQPLGTPELRIAERHQTLVTILLRKPVRDLQ
jgi:hypothetical protein